MVSKPQPAPGPPIQPADPAANTAAAGPAAPGALHQSYKVGTLTYTKASLIATIFWLMVGSVAFRLMESVFPSSITLQLLRLHVPIEWIPVMTVTLAQVLNLSLSPVISFRSDRTRGRWGRRIPYIVLTMPGLCLCLAGLGFTDDIGRWIRHSAWPAQLHLPPLVLIMLLVGLLVVGFQAFNAVLNTVYWYLSVDVLPPQVLGRFNGVSGIVGSGTGMFFSYFIYGRLQNAACMHEVYIGAALVYLVGMGLMCSRVREGRYPPPTDVVVGAGFWRRVAMAARVYLRECFSHPIYLAYFAASALFALSNACSFAVLPFFLYDLGFSMARMGQFGTLLGFIGILVAYPMGSLVDRMHPIRAMLLVLVCLVPLNIATFFMSSFIMYMAVESARLVVNRLLSSAQNTLTMRLMPRQQYGQFCSANDIVTSLVMIPGTIIGGLYISHFNLLHGPRGFSYFWLWAAGFDLATLACLLVVYFYWERMGKEQFSYDPVTRGTTAAG